MTSSIFKKSAALNSNAKRLPESTKSLLNKNYAAVQSPLELPNNLPNLLRSAIKEAETFQKIGKISQAKFFEKYVDRYEQDSDSKIASNYSSYLNKGKRPEPIRLKKILGYLSEEAGHSLYFSPEEIEVLHSIPSELEYDHVSHNFKYTPVTLTKQQKALLDKQKESSWMLLNSSAKYFYPQTLFENSDELFVYLNKVFLQSLHAMLLLNQQMYWLKWDEIEGLHISPYKSNSDFLQANIHTNDIVYTKAKLISNINLVEQEMFDKKYIHNAKYIYDGSRYYSAADVLHTDALQDTPICSHSYTDVLRDPLVRNDKELYSSKELNALFQQYYPCVFSLFNYWKNKIPDKIYSIFKEKISRDFGKLCNDLEFQKHQIVEKDFVFTSIADTLCELLYSENNIVKRWDFNIYEERSKYIF